MRKIEIGPVVPGGVVNHQVKSTDPKTAQLSYWKHRLHKPYALDWKEVTDEVMSKRSSYTIPEVYISKKD